MAKGNPLQEQLLKAGLVKKSKLAEVAREQHKARHGKGAPAPSEIQRDAERARAEKVERDRALEAERKAEARAAKDSAAVQKAEHLREHPLRSLNLFGGHLSAPATQADQQAQSTES